MTHLDFDQISETADGHASDDAARHLAECAECRETLSRVRELLAVAHALPRDIAPPPEVWTSLRQRVVRAPRRGQAIWLRIGALAMAAAVVLMVGTAILLRPAAKAKGAKLGPQPAIPVAVATVDRNYSTALAELRETLDAQRAALSPATVQTVERSLAVIDSAISEARAALAVDPANQALVDILAARYEHKVDLLQRASELSSSN